MTKQYFTLDENFEYIIKKALNNYDIISIDQISTGWTNIVFEVVTNNGTFFFRFPRDEFWTRTIVKDCEFSQYIQNKTTFNIVKLNLLYDNNRPFSMHQKIEGVPLAEVMDKLNNEEIKQVSKEISAFMFELHNLSFDKNNIFTTNNIGLNLVDFLNELLELHLSEKDKQFWDYQTFIKKEHHCLVHGDLNSSNIILDNKNHIAAIIDLGFAGFGNKYFDIARIIGRCPITFKDEIIKSYEEISNNKLDIKTLNNEIDIWTNIDNGYINYMTEIGIYKP